MEFAGRLAVLSNRLERDLDFASGTIELSVAGLDVYEAYVDLERGAWTTMRIVVDGTRARLYVNNAQQPCLIVNDLRLGATGGRVGLWIGPGTVGYFSRMVVTPSALSH